MHNQTKERLYQKCTYLYDKLNHARILTGSYLWSVGGQTHNRYQQKQHVAFSSCKTNVDGMLLLSVQ